MGQKHKILFGIYGAEFVVPFSSHSRSLALKSSLKSHQKWQLCFQNDKVFTQMMTFSLKPLFWTKKVVIWWLFNDDLRAREREREEKRTRNSAPWRHSHCTVPKKNGHSAAVQASRAADAVLYWTPRSYLSPTLSFEALLKIKMLLLLTIFQIWTFGTFRM